MPDKDLNQAVRICKVLYRVEFHDTSWFTDMLNQTCKEFTTHNTGALLGLFKWRTQEAITYNFYIEQAKFYYMERHSCLIRLLGMMIFQVRLYATELPLYLVRFTSVIIVSFIVTRF